MAKPGRKTARRRASTKGERHKQDRDAKTEGRAAHEEAAEAGVDPPFDGPDERTIDGEIYFSPHDLTRIMLAQTRYNQALAEHKVASTELEKAELAWLRDQVKLGNGLMRAKVEADRRRGELAAVYREIQLRYGFKMEPGRVTFDDSTGKVTIQE